MPPPTARLYPMSLSFSTTAMKPRQAGFYDAVKLNALAGRDAQSVVAIARREIIKNSPLRRSHHAAGNTSTDHHDVFFAGLAQVAIILLVGAVKLQELIVVIRE